MSGVGYRVLVGRSPAITRITMALGARRGSHDWESSISFRNSSTIHLARSSSVTSAAGPSSVTDKKGTAIGAQGSAEEGGLGVCSQGSAPKKWAVCSARRLYPKPETINY